MTEIRSENLLSTVQSQLAGGFLPLLLSLVLLFVLAFLIDEWTAGRVALSLLFFTIMVAAVKLSVRRRRTFLIVLAAAALSWAAVVADEIFGVLEMGAAGRIVVLALLAFAIYNKEIQGPDIFEALPPQPA